MSDQLPEATRGDPSEKIGVAIVGCGWVAAFAHLPNIRRSRRCRLVAMVDRSEERLAFLSTKFPRTYVTSKVEDVFHDRSVEAIIVAAPPQFHARVILDYHLRPRHFDLSRSHAILGDYGSTFPEAGIGSSLNWYLGRDCNGCQPLISVVVPTYQRPDALQRCLRALTTQELPREHYEVIVIDDGRRSRSDDRQRSNLQPGSDPCPSSNQGPAAARNHGAQLARGRWLAFTDDDCAPRPSWLCILLGRLEQNPAALVGGQTLNALANNVYAQASQDLVDFLYDYFPRAVSLRPFLTSNNFAADRKRFLELGGFDASFPFAAAEDRDYSERWTTAGGSLSYAPDAKIEHFQVLTLKQFFLQHHRYGRGAARLARVRALRGDGRP